MQKDGWTNGRMDEQTDLTKLIVAFCHFGMRVKRDVRKTEVGVRGAMLWNYCSIAEFDGGRGAPDANEK